VFIDHVTLGYMSLERVKKLLRQKESIRLEFKESKSDLPANLFETICSMLNREGGDILLGVSDNRTVKGIESDFLENITASLVALSNNPNKLDPPFILFPKIYTLKGKPVIHVQVPESSQVHRTASLVYDRSNDGDFKVTRPQQIAEIYNRKRMHYTEGIVYPGLGFSDFKPELFLKIRNLISSHNPSHPWLAVDDDTMLRMAGLWKRDHHSNKEGYTLAAALLLGKDEVIQSILPHYKVDVLVRRVDLLRYDDREYIQTNLIDAYDQLMAFVNKHLPDKFYMEGDQRISLRTKIFREVIANLIVHREYTNGYPATFIIYSDRVETENANNPHGEGPIDSDNFTPFPKNPSIAKFFIQLGRVEELGSGVLNVNRFLEQYAPGKKPQFVEGTTFKTVLPLDDTLADANTLSEEDIHEVVKRALSDGNDGVNDGVKKQLIAVVEAIVKRPGIRADEIAKAIKKAKPTAERYIKRLRDAHVIEFKGAPKTGGYFVTMKINRKLKRRSLK